MGLLLGGRSETDSKANHPTLGPELRLISHAMPMDLSYLGDVNHQVQQIYCDFNVSGGFFFMIVEIE